MRQRQQTRAIDGRRLRRRVQSLQPLLEIGHTLRRHVPACSHVSATNGFSGSTAPYYR